MKTRPPSARHAALLELLRTSQFATGDELAHCLTAALAPLGLRATCYLVDEEQRQLWPLGQPGEPVAVDGTLPGRAFTTTETQTTGSPGTSWHMLVPLIDGSERLGIVDIQASDVDASEMHLGMRRWCETLVNLFGHLIAIKLDYGDTLHQTRRTRRMSVASEILLGILPPMTCRSSRVAISCLLEPSYEVGGDAFDYAIDGPHARFHLLDAMGHGLNAASMTVTATAAIRAARRDGLGLYATARAADEALLAQFEAPFVTGIIAELDTITGRLRYIDAGHPRPLLMRRQKVVRELDAGRRLPFGLDDSAITVGEEMLEPGDRLLLYTDGVIEARKADGELFGIERLVDFAEQSALAKVPPPETLRTLSRRVRDFEDGPMRDDATMMLIDWVSAHGS